MNWLAHLRLAPQEPLVRLGNLAGDFVRGVDLTTLHADLRQGIMQHRAIDRFVDAHPIARRSRGRLEPRFRRFAGVLVDVYYDHFLARDWAMHGDGHPLQTFVDEVHRQLNEHRDLLPPRLAEVLPWMQRQAWLVGYAEIDGIQYVLRRMARRFARPTPLGEGAAQLCAHYSSLGDDFAALWPELEAFASDGP